MVEPVGNAPTATILQGSSAPLCWPRGASTWFRATLSASSARRCHQISFRGELADLRESNTLVRSGAPRLSQSTKPAVNSVLSRSFSAAHSRASGNPVWHARYVWPWVPAFAGTNGSDGVRNASNGGERTESNLLPERGRVYSAATAPACPYLRSPCLVAEDGIEPSASWL